MVKWSSVGDGDTLVKRVYPIRGSSVEGPCYSERWWQEIREGIQVEGARSILGLWQGLLAGLISKD